MEFHIQYCFFHIDFRAMIQKVSGTFLQFTALQTLFMARVSNPSSSVERIL
jgi:hypothetical protein